MKALVYTDTCQLEYRSEPDPIPEVGEAIIQVKASGICGSDMHAYFGHDERRIAPLILGHEVSGQVLSGSKKGKRVVVNPLVSCNQCLSCTNGHENLCQSRQMISMQPRQGAFSELLRVPERNLVSLPDDMSYLHAALTEPVATSWHAVMRGKEMSNCNIGDAKVLILGGGAIGLSCALILHSLGCSDITLGETNQLRRTTVQKANVCKLYNPLDISPEDNSYDIIYDAVGGRLTREASSKAIKPGGAIVHIGLMDSNDGLDIRKLTLQEVTFGGCYTYTMRDFKDTVDALYNGSLGKLDWIEQRPLSEGGNAFVDLSQGKTAAAKIILVPEG